MLTKIFTTYGHEFVVDSLKTNIGADNSKSGNSMLNIKLKPRYFMILVSLIGCLLLVYFYETTSYMPIDVPHPLSYLPNGINWKVSNISQHFTDEYGRVLIIRKEGRAYGAYDGYVFDSAGNVLSYFDSYLIKQNWKQSNADPYYQCQYGFPEKKYVSELHFLEYIRKGDNPDNATRKICVAVIAQQRLPWEKTDTFNVIVISIRYSPITEFLERFRKW